MVTPVHRSFSVAVQKCFKESLAAKSNCGEPVFLSKVAAQPLNTQLYQENGSSTDLANEIH